MTAEPAAPGPTAGRAFALRAAPSWLPAVGLAVAVVGTPFGNEQVPGLGVALMLPATAVGTAIAAVALVAARRPLVVPSAILALAAATVAIGAIAVAEAPDTALALRVASTAVIGLGFAAVIAAACRDARAWHALLATVLLAGGATCAVSLRSVSELHSAVGGAVVTGRLTGPFGQPNELGAFAGIMVVLAMAVLATSHHVAAVAGAAVVLVTALAALALSLSRGAWLGALGGTVVLLVCLPQARRRLLWVAPVAALAISVGYLVWPAPSPPTANGVLATIAQRATTLLDPGADPYDQRPAIWSEALHQIRSAPLLGHGPGNFSVIAATSSASAPEIDAEHAHDLALTTAAETGLLGLAMLAATVLAGVRAVVRVLADGDAATRARTVTAAAALAVVLGQGVVDFPLSNAVLALLTWLLVGLLTAATTGSRS